MAWEQHSDKGHSSKSSSKKYFSKRQSKILSDNSQSDGESSDEEQYIPILNKIRKSAKIHCQVDKRIRDLEQQSKIAGSLGKIKSKRGGNVEILVK